uniref:Uncharacterized protein n=1 Tax=Octopus bimaculoides TaxID=37653 RepID=A0A0L8HS96_OCTBM
MIIIIIMDIKKTRKENITFKNIRYFTLSLRFKKLFKPVTNISLFNTLQMHLSIFKIRTQ